MLFELAFERAQSNPGEACAIAGGILLGGYVLKRILNPSLYRNIDGPDSHSFIYGHLRSLYSPLGLPFHDSLQDSYGSLSKVKGWFGDDRLYISDPRALQEILVKENDTAFQRTRAFLDFSNLAFGPGLLATAGAVHKTQRKMMNPVFTSTHMRALVPTFELIAQDLKGAINNELEGSGSKDLDMLQWCSAAALELIGQAGIGHTFGIFQGAESVYNHAIKSFLPALNDLLPFQPIMMLIYNMRPASWRRKIAESVPHRGVQRLKEIIDIQDEQAQAILRDKKDNLHISRGGDEPSDIMSILIQANQQAAEGERLPEDQLLGQMNTFIFAGHETTSGALARVLHILSLDQGMQDRLRAELQATPSNLDYNELNALEYLDAICHELLRLYPPLTTTEREAIKDWVLPLRYPVKGKDGREIREVKVKKGTQIYIAMRQANRCKETWGEDADEFKPERWLKDLPSSVAESRTPGVYSSLMTFLAGPRACIGFRFSLLELKVMLVMLVRSFRFAPAGTAVEWRLGQTMCPFELGVKLEELHPRLPLNVTRL